MTKDEALKLALEALQFALHVGFPESSESQIKKGEKAYQQHRAAITAIKEALAQPEVFSKQNYLNGYCVGQSDLLAEQAKQEPAAWMVYTQDGQSVYVTDNPIDIQENQRALPMYTTPPQRTWVGLNEEEIKAFDTWHDNREEEKGWVAPSEIVAYISEKLRSKNT